MCDNCEEELITTSQGPQGETGVTGDTGANGTDGILNWEDLDLSCWITEGITEEDATNDEISQDMIDALCEVYQAIHKTPVAVNDYRVMNQDTTLYIDVINNDLYYPDVTVTLPDPASNGTATIEPDGKTIKYIPNSGFVGIEDFSYIITDTDSNTSTAVITIDVQAVISQQTVQETVLEQLQILLASDDYWDLGFNIGDKIGISNINLTDFDFTNPFTAGIGKPGRYSKWAICNGNNGAEDLTEGTFRGFDSTNSDYDESAKSGGSDTVSLVRANIPSHRHKSTQYTLDWNTYATDWATKHTLETGGNTEVNKYQLSSGGITDSGNDQDYYVSTSNTGDGTDNIGNQSEIANGTGTVTPVDIRNEFKTVILIQKIA
jgi:hypothetical protein